MIVPPFLAVPVSPHVRVDILFERPSSLFLPSLFPRLASSCPPIITAPKRRVALPSQTSPWSVKPILRAHALRARWKGLIESLLATMRKSVKRGAPFGSVGLISCCPLFLGGCLFL